MNLNPKILIKQPKITQAKPRRNSNIKQVSLVGRSSYPLNPPKSSCMKHWDNLTGPSRGSKKRAGFEPLCDVRRQGRRGCAGAGGGVGTAAGVRARRPLILNIQLRVTTYIAHLASRAWIESSACILFIQHCKLHFGLPN